jgi:hypothetical protein
MPTPPLSPELAQAAIDALDEHGKPYLAAKELGINPNTFASRIKIAEKRGLKPAQDPAIQAAMKAIGTGMVPTLAWAKTKNEDGTSFSVLLRPDATSSDSLERIRDVLEGMTPAPIIAAPTHKVRDTLTLYPIPDAHVGLLAWERETGEAYDTKRAVARLQSWMGQCVAASPPSETAVVLGVGDMTHGDDQTNQTPGHKHQLDVDGRHFQTLEVTIAAIAVCVELALKKHKRVICRILPGNHDKTAYMAVLFAIAERFRENPRVEVQKEPGEFWAFEFGRVMLCAHHGDKGKAERMVMALADNHSEMWGRTKFRFLFTGHLHHHKSADIGGVQWEQLRAVTAKDAYAVAHGYTARAEMQAVTYHRDRGEVSRVRVNA